MKKLIAALLRGVCKCAWQYGRGHGMRMRVAYGADAKSRACKAVPMPKPSFPSHLLTIQVHTNDRAVCGGSGTVVATCATKGGFRKCGKQHAADETMHTLLAENEVAAPWIHCAATANVAHGGTAGHDEANAQQHRRPALAVEAWGQALQKRHCLRAHREQCGAGVG